MSRKSDQLCWQDSMKPKSMDNGAWDKQRARPLPRFRWGDWCSRILTGCSAMTGIVSRLPMTQVLPRRISQRSSVRGGVVCG
jgi:hypothetical protein